MYHYGLESGGGINANLDIDTYYTADKEMGTHFGVFAINCFDKFFIRPEIDFRSLKNNYPLAGKTSHWTSKKIVIPILFGYKIYKPVSLYARPSFSTISSMELEGVESPIIFEKGRLLETKSF